MPAQFSFFCKTADTKVAPTIHHESPDKSYVIFKRTLPIYNTDNLKTTQIIGSYTAMYTSVSNPDDLFTSTQNIIKFFENSGLPYGDDNILVTTSTKSNKVENNIVIDGKYTLIISANESTGKYANQVGYNSYTKDSSKIFIKHDVYFPLPILTYTNAFNSISQPSTAPLPA